MLRVIPANEYDDALERRTRAFHEIDQMIRPIENLDYDRELAEYRWEKYNDALLYDIDR